MLKKGIFITITIALTLGLSISFQNLLAAWQAPSENPPAGNLAELLHTGTDPQSKDGPLVVHNTDSGAPIGLRIVNGSITVDSGILNTVEGNDYLEIRASDDSFRFFSNNNNVFAITSWGGVGIGKEPIEALDVVGNAIISNGLIVETGKTQTRGGLIIEVCEDGVDCPNDIGTPDIGQIWLVN